VFDSDATMSGDNPTNPVTNGVATVRTVFDFGFDVANKVWEGPVKLGLDFYQDGSTARELKKKLGEWVLEAQDDQDRWQQPVLSKDAFESHLVKENGQFQPSGVCTALFSWAKLLYALNIRPKQGENPGIISWREVPEGESSPAKTGIISLAFMARSCVTLSTSIRCTQLPLLARPGPFNCPSANSNYWMRTNTPTRSEVLGIMNLHRRDSPFRTACATRIGFDRATSSSNPALSLPCTYKLSNMASARPLSSLAIPRNLCQSESNSLKV